MKVNANFAKKENISRIIRERLNARFKQETVFRNLKNIYEKNKKHVFENPDIELSVYNSDLLNLVSDVSLLIVCYERIVNNPEITNLIYSKIYKQVEKLKLKQRRFLEKSDKDIDRISLKVFQLTSKLLKQGRYPWGSKKFIYIQKLGKPCISQPLNIPVFMDTVVQEAIRQILTVVYEPLFDKMHLSFGFEPNRAVHDAIYSLTNKHSENLDMALEGNIKFQYNNVNQEKLLEILNKRIKDRKFLNLIKQKLDYECDKAIEDSYIKDQKILLQFPTYSEYLLNIYMLEFDIFIEKEIKRNINEINLKNRGDLSHRKEFMSLERNAYVNTKTTIMKILNWIRRTKKNKGTFKLALQQLYNTDLTKWKEFDPIFIGPLTDARNILRDCDLYKQDEITIMRDLQKKAKKIQHFMGNLPLLNINKKKLRILYVRYANDWIILTNLNKDLLEKIKKKISDFLKEKLYFGLSEVIILLKDITKESVPFLGFKIKTYKEMKIRKKKQYTYSGRIKVILSNTVRYRVFAAVDKKKLVERLFIQGYCDKHAFPREMSKLNNLEAFTIIDKANSVLVRLVNFYANFIKNPKSNLSRWVYIIRFSCIKTLALKYKTTIKEILTTFQPEDADLDQTDTVEDKIVIEVGNKRYLKKYKLYTLHSLMNRCKKKLQQLNTKGIMSRYWDLTSNNSILPEIDEKTNNVLVGNNDFFKFGITASFQLPCCICGCENNIKMHHIKYVRETKCNQINKEETWQQVMGHKNKRKIPVCKFCYIKYIHKGKFCGSHLKDLSIDKIYYNRIVNMRSYISISNTNVDYTRSLSLKGWKLVEEK